jgi:ubiquinone/menaquinone biosynthesis C-methylase UbiE
MENIRDDNGFNQVWGDSLSTRVRARRRRDYMVSKAGITSASRVLEIGCGTGSNAYQLASSTGADVIGVDICESFVEQARAKYQLPNLRYQKADFNSADDLANEQFDCVVGNGILHHLYDNLDEAFFSMKRLLKPGGEIVFLEPNIGNPYVYLIFTFKRLRVWARLEPTEMAFSRCFAIEKLQRIGFANISVEYRDFLIPGVPSVLIYPLVLLGAVLEKIPGLRCLSQSIFLSASK